jgi:hypothetical protein
LWSAHQLWCLVFLLLLLLRAGAAERNAVKAGLLYDTISGSNGFYFSPVEESVRSKMNVPFTIPSNADLEKAFIAGVWVCVFLGWGCAGGGCLGMCVVCFAGWEGGSVVVALWGCRGWGVWFGDIAQLDVVVSHSIATLTWRRPSLQVCILGCVDVEGAGSVQLMCGGVCRP